VSSSPWRRCSYTRCTWLFFIELATLRLHITAATPNPDGTFLTQQARNLFMADELQGLKVPDP
jgi:hypothetical protein